MSIEQANATSARFAVDDIELLVHIRDGSNDALTQLFRRHARAVFALAYSRLRDPSEAEEVVQDTFILFWERRHSIVMASASALPWLLATARYKSLARSKSLARRRTDSLEERNLVSAADDGPAAIVETRVLEDFLAGIVEALPEIDRKIYELCVAGGLSYAEAASTLGITHASLRGRLTRLRSRLRGELSFLKGQG